MKKCLTCNHKVDSNSSHDHCRSHAACVRGAQYTSNGCPICEDLWSKAGRLEDPDEAVAAYDILSYWINGFSKNSRHRRPGEDIFVFADERLDMFELHVYARNLKTIKEWDLLPPPPMPDAYQASPTAGPSSRRDIEVYSPRRSPSPQQRVEDDFLGTLPTLTPLQPEVVLLTKWIDILKMMMYYQFTA